jgi:hypothetical protein
MLSREHLARLRSERATAERQTQTDDHYQAFSKGRTEAFESLRCKLPSSQREPLKHQPYLVHCDSFTAADPRALTGIEQFHPHGEFTQYRSVLGSPIASGPEEMYPMEFQVSAYRNELRHTVDLHASALWNACVDEVDGRTLMMVLIARVVPFKWASDNRMIVGPRRWPW